MGKADELRVDRNRDPLDNLSAIWILASNDDNPAISYEGLCYRLRLDGGVEEVRRLVAEHGELFRPMIPEPRLAELKEKYRAGKSLPSWLKQKPEGAHRDAVIEKLTANDFFRSQFRAGSKAPRSPIEIVDWGLQHINRLRETAVEARNAPMKRWSSLWIPLLSTFIALIAVGSTMYVQRQASIDQRALKEYEVSFRPKVDGYTRFLQAVSTSFERAMTVGRPRLRDALNEMDLAAIQLEPFLKPDVRDRLRDQVQRFTEFCLHAGPLAQKAAIPDEANDQFLRYRNGFRATLYAALFR